MSTRHSRWDFPAKDADGNPILRRRWGFLQGTRPATFQGVRVTKARERLRNVLDRRRRLRQHERDSVRCVVPACVLRLS